MAEPMDGGAVQRVALRNHMGIAELSIGGQLERRYRFGARRLKPEAGKLTQVEGADGKLLERYEYDSAGRVIRAWQEPDRTIEFSYGPDGSLEKTAVVGSSQ